MRWLVGLGVLAASIGGAVVASRSKQRRRRTLGDADPHASTAQECIKIGRRHAFNPDAPYRVCLSPNQEHVLFADKSPKKLGCGVFACAYEGPKSNQATKLTVDSEDVAALLKAQKTGVVPKVFAAYQMQHGGHSIDSGEEAPVYAVVVEKLRTIFEGDRKNVDREIVDIRGVASGRMTGDEFCDSRGGCSDLQLAVVAATEKLRKAGIVWADVHAGNIGYDERGKLKVLDLGLTSTQLEKRLEILKGLGRAKKFNSRAL